MKILLIQPPILDFYQTSVRTQPIGLAYLASSLRSQGYEVEILDCQTGKRKSAPVPPELSYLQDFYPFNDRSPFKLYTGYYHFGLEWEEIAKKIKDSRADVYGISSSFTPYGGEALKIARIIKEREKGKLVIMGGSHVTCDPESVLKNPFVDYVVLGEGEERVPLLLGQIEKGGKKGLKGIDGIGYRSGGEIEINPLQGFIRDLDGLPYPARDLLDLNRYQIGRKCSTMMITSRGCPHGCVYCSGHLVMGSAFRARAPEAIVQEMVECRNRFGVERFDIEDDNFTFDRKRACRLLKLIIEAFGENRVGLTAMNGISLASLDGDLLQLLKRAGFETINISFVSADNSTRRRMQRPVGPMDFAQVLNEAETAGLHVVAYAILGMPGQTSQEMAETLIYLMGRRVLIGPSIYYPTPGTPLFERCKTDGILPIHPSQWRSSAMPVETQTFSRVDLLTLFRLARVINFVKGKMDKGELSEGMTLKGLGQMLREKAGGNSDFESENNPVNCNPPGITHTQFRRDEGVTWMKLLLLLLKERAFFGLKRDSERSLSLFREQSSHPLLDYFIEKGQDVPILKSRQTIP
jgi:anaerobic magnesium-protoporphyrin IX monomethyl ester cyclase